MNRYRISALLASSLLLSGPAWSAPTAKQACEELKARAVEVLHPAQAPQCWTDGKTLALEGSAEDFPRVRAALFPRDLYREFRVVRREAVPAAAAVLSTEKMPVIDSEFKGLTPSLDFDGASAHRGAIVLVAGPPGSQPPGQNPPGHNPPGHNPPGHNPPGNDAPPPSRPTPVFVPQAPPPSYWNTVDWGTVPMWANLPYDWQ